MDTETHIPIELANEDVLKDIPEIAQEDEAWLMTYTIVDKNIQEISQLYSIFRYNLDRILSEYELFLSDKFKRKNQSTEYSDFIAINALTINYASASKSLLTAMENFEKLFVDEEETDFKKTYTKKAYDDYFSYRLMDMVRNCSQHGTLPVSLKDEKISFDVSQMLNLLHFKYKKSFEKELINLSERVLEEYGASLQLAYMYHIPEYNYIVCALYASFWGHIKKYISEIQGKLTEIVDREPKLFYEKNCIRFKANGQVHMIIGEANLEKFCKSCEEEAKQIKKREQTEWFSIRKSFRNGTKATRKE